MIPLETNGSSAVDPNRYPNGDVSARTLVSSAGAAPGQTVPSQRDAEWNGGGSEDDESDDDCMEGKKTSCGKKLSSLSTFVISVSIFHALAVIAFQSTILGLGDFSAVCAGGLGVDRKIYAILFITAMAYVIALVVWALYSENIVEMYAFGVIQLLSIAYSCTQVYQFYIAQNDFEKLNPNDHRRDNYEAPIILAVSNVILSVVMEVFYIYAIYHLYIEFGWKIYTTVPFNSEAKLRSAFSTYQVFTCFLKVELIFTEIFLLSHVALLLRDDPHDPEFIASVLAMVLAIAVTLVVYFAVRREKKVIMFLFLVILLAMVGYYTYKVFRFVTQSCRLCQKELEATCPSIVDGVQTTSAPLENLTFEHLTLFAVIVDINTTLLFIVALSYLSKFGTGLEKIFTKMEKKQLRYARETLRVALTSVPVHASNDQSPDLSGRDAEHTQKQETNGTSTNADSRSHTNGRGCTNSRGHAKVESDGYVSQHLTVCPNDKTGSLQSMTSTNTVEAQL